MSAAAARHEPVMAAEVVEALQPRDGGNYVDATFGAGGYSRAILDAADCRVWAIDRDPDAIRDAAGLIGAYEGRLTVMQGRFGDMDRLLAERGVGPVDGVAFDLGVSSMQLDDPARGFSFRADGPLDMRQERSGRSAADVVNETPEGVLADIIYRFGEERQARRIAGAIVRARNAGPITGTAQLAEIVRGAWRGGKAAKIDPATRTFQAIRIQVNGELDELERGLEAAEIVLAPGGRLAVVSFHSLEDRIVKEFLRSRAGATPSGSRHLPATADVRRPAAPSPAFRLTRRGAIKPGAAETARNPRARSARLRVAERTAAPAARQER